MVFGIDDVIVDSLGVGLPQLILIATFFFGLIICAKDYKIGAMIWTILFLAEFVIFYQYSIGYDWVQPLVAWFVSIVLMMLLMFMGFWNYEDTRKIIT